jgi:hypothetical protein
VIYSGTKAKSFQASFKSFFLQHRRPLTFNALPVKRNLHKRAISHNASPYPATKFPPKENVFSVRDNTAVGTKVAVDTHFVNASNHPEHDTFPAYSGTSQTKRPKPATLQIMGSSRAVQAVSSNPSVTPQIVEPAKVINHIR